eukprot:12852340-Heterocapsa_arctica.AAC.1
METTLATKPGRKLITEWLKTTRTKSFRGEETEAIRKRKNRKMDHASDNQDLDQVHRYVHEGLRQGGIQLEANIVAIE